MTIGNLRNAFAAADKIDRHEGEQAYFRYHQLMADLGAKYDCPIERVIAVFVSLSPNSTYHHNLRGAVSVLKAVREGVPVEDVIVATYRHCLLRAYEYATGAANFLERNRGPKVLNFYHNVLDPTDHRWVTIDGHMSALWQGQTLTMREALISLRTYREIANDTKRLAFEQFMLPQQMQAILWFVRKRVLRIGFTEQTNIFQLGDQWKTARNADDIQPYPYRTYVGPEHMGGAMSRTSNIRPDGERPGAMGGRMPSGVRDRGPDRLRLGDAMGMAQAVLPWQEQVLFEPGGNSDDRRTMDGRTDGQADTEPANGKPDASFGDHGPDGDTEADA